jgi:hypothetical protein
VCRFHSSTDSACKAASAPDGGGQQGAAGIVLYDGDTDEEICRATMKPAPHEAAFSRDGRTLYVPVYSPANVGQPGRTSTRSISSAPPTAASNRRWTPASICGRTFPEVGASGMIYVTAEMKESILLVDPKTRRDRRHDSHRART